MPRTRIPANLIHRPEEVERNAERFDNLCRLAEEVAYPVVQEALFREYLETAATGAEVLSNEAKHTLEALAEEAALLEDLDEKHVLEEVQRSLSDAIPPPDEEECRQHAREFSQVLMSTWLELLRDAQSNEGEVLLSDYLTPELPSTEIPRLTEQFGADRLKLPQILRDALGSFALSEDDVTAVLATLRGKLFSEPRLVDLPFDLVMIGTLGEPVLVLTRSLYDELMDEIERQLKKRKKRRPTVIQQRVHTSGSVTLEPAIISFVTVPAKQAVVSLSEPLPVARYACFAKVALLKDTNIETRVRHALAAIP